MKSKRRRRRVIVVRGRRRYIVCGVQYPPSRVTSRLVAWIPGATVLLTLLVSMYAIGFPQQTRPVVAVSPYSLEDFANASRR